MTRIERLASMVALVWAGVAIGGSLIATPAKFAAPSLSLPTALEVGRAQFFWVGVGEWMLCVALVMAMLLSGRFRQWLLLASVAIFLTERLWLLPLLDVRTVQIIAGETVAESHLHVLYIVAEVAKVIALIGGGFVAMNASSSQESDIV